MKQRTLGDDLTVSALGLGCMPMAGVGKNMYGAANADESIATIHRAIDLGVTFFDTAEIYGPHANEELVGRAIKGKREGLVIATKFGFRIEDGAARGTDSSPANVRAACEGSLKRLGIETIDLFYQHRVDPKVPIEETVGAMAELVKEGKVRHLGLSEAGAATLRKAAAIHPIAALQSEYSLWERDVEEEILPTCRELGIGFVPVSAERSAADQASGIGQSFRRSGMTAADMSVVAHRITTNRTMPRNAIRPARAASAVAPTPFTSSPTTSGTMTICKPCSHASPIGWVTAVAAIAASRANATAAMPRIRPKIRAVRIRVAWDMLALHSLFDYQQAEQRNGRRRRWQGNISEPTGFAG